MATIPSKPHDIFHLDIMAGEHSVESGTTKAFESEGDMVIHCPDVDKAAILTKAQAMAFFDLVPRYNPDEEMGANDRDELERLRWLRQQEEDGYSTTG